MASTKRLSYEYVKSEIEKGGRFELLSKEYTNQKTNLIIKDKDGYLYSLNYSALIYNLRNKNNNPDPITVYNKFSIENIKTWLKINDKTFEYVCGEYIRNISPLVFKCFVCGEEFCSNWMGIRIGNGCSFCSGHKIGKSNNLLIMYPELCKEWDYESNTGKPEEYLFSSRTSVWWICGVCGERWKTEIDHRTRVNSGCPYCSPSGHKVGKRNSMEFLFPEIAREWNYEKNYPLLPSQVRPYTKRKVFWTCINCGNIWEAAIGARTRYLTGCQKCNYSCGELKIDTLLMSIGISYFPQWKFGDCKYINELSYDFYLPYFDAVIEYDGKYHHEVKYYKNRTKEQCEKEFELIKIRDAVKDKYCQKNGINIIRIPYWEYDNIEKIIGENLNL